MIGETPLLEFKEESDENLALTEEQQGTLNEINTKSSARAEELQNKIQLGEDSFENLAKEYIWII